MSRTSGAFQSSFSEERWVTQMNKSVSEQVTVEVAPPPISVFRVPKTILDIKPEAYIPQQIGLGPYHHFHTAMQKTLRLKLAAVKHVLTNDQILNFQPLVVDKLKRIEPSIRACYDEYLDLDGDALAWLMTLDGIFLLYRLGYGLTKNPKFNPPGDATLSEISPHPRVLDSIDDHDHSEEIRVLAEEIEELESPILWKNMVKIPEEMVVHPRDILMLENQIPFLVLKEIQDALHLSSKDMNNSLDDMLAAFADEHSPLQLLPKVKFHHGDSPAHLLDFMYNLVVSNIKPKPKLKHGHGAHHGRHGHEPSNPKFEGFKMFLNNLKESISMAFSDDSLPKPLLLLKNLFFLGSDAQFDAKSGQNAGKSAVEEIKIPSAHELSDLGGVTFSITQGGIRDIRYDEKELIFYLPVINLHNNSEVILRNMIAYEQALIPSGSNLELTEYVELMCGIVDTDNDAKLLREKGIIKGGLSDDGVVDLFNGIPRHRYHPQGISEMRRACHRVRKHFQNRPIVKVCRFVKRQIILWWKILLTLSVVAILLLVLYQQVCKVYGCSTHIFGQQPLMINHSNL